jgi:hypothetical protein
VIDGGGVGVGVVGVVIDSGGMVFAVAVCISVAI